MTMKLHGKGEKTSPNEIGLTLTILRDNKTVFKCTHYFENGDYFEAIKMFKFARYSGPTHFSVFGFYSEEEKAEEDFWEKKEYEAPTLEDCVDREDY